MNFGNLYFGQIKTHLGVFWRAINLKLEVKHYQSLINYKTMPSTTSTVVNLKSIPTSGSPSRDIITKKLMEQFGQVRQQATQSAQQMSQVASNKAEQARNWLIETAKVNFNRIQEYSNRYPPLGAFLFILMLASALPLGIFILFSIFTTITFLSIALISFGVVEGFFLVTGGAILLAILGGITFVTAVGFAWIGSIYAIYKGGYSLLGRLPKSANYLSQNTRGTIQQIMNKAYGGVAEIPNQFNRRSETETNN